MRSDMMVDPVALQEDTDPELLLQRLGIEVSPWLDGVVWRTVCSGQEVAFCNVVHLALVDALKFRHRGDLE